MTLSANQSSKVITQEINLSQIITSASTSVAAQIIVAKQGATLAPIQFTSGDDYIAQYGNPDAQISFDQYCGKDYFSEGNRLWGLRIVGTGALYSSILMWTDGTTTHLTPITAGVADPTQPNWTALLPAGANNEAIALFYPAKGQGSYGNNLAMSISSPNIQTPTGLAVTSSSTGGQLVAATYEYQISSLSPQGETLATSAVQVIISGAGVTNSTTLNWNADPLAIGYKVYGRVAGSLGLIATIGAGTNTFIDTGAVAPDTTKQPITSPANAAQPSNLFGISLYDTTQSTTYPIEQFTCSLTDFTDTTGTETELEQRINPFSTNLQVTSNVPALLTVPTVTAASLASMAGGNSGAAPTSTQVAAAWATFSNKQLYGLNILMNSGHSTPDVQIAMDTLAQQRQDSVALLDVPSASQAFQAAINYRNLQLNLNSTYSALFAPDVKEADNINGKQVFVPFSGWAAALCARTDRVANPSYSIAGLNRGLLNILGTRYTYEPGQMDALFQAQVNYTQTFIGQGTALWEQQTLSSQMSALSWLSVRRIVNVMKTSIYSFLLYSLQEPDDDFLGRQIVEACDSYLTAVQNARGITSSDVVSDSSNNSAADLNSGIRNVTVVIVPKIPTHIINLQMVISKQGVTFTEVLSQVNPG